MRRRRENERSYGHLYGNAPSDMKNSSRCLRKDVPPWAAENPRMGSISCGLSHHLVSIAVSRNFSATAFSNGTGITCSLYLSLIHISEPTRLRRISYAVFC